jgi:hypothetical protein
MNAYAGAVSACPNSAIPERDMLRALVDRVQRVREGKDSMLEKTPTQKPSNVRVWGKQAHQREFVMNADGSASHFVRNGETLRAIVSDVLRELSSKRGAHHAYEPSYTELAYTMAEVKRFNGHIADFDILNHGQEIRIPQAMVRSIA